MQYFCYYQHPLWQLNTGKENHYYCNQHINTCMYKCMYMQLSSNFEPMKTKKKNKPIDSQMHGKFLNTFCNLDADYTAEMEQMYIPASCITFNCQLGFMQSLAQPDPTSAYIRNERRLVKSLVINFCTTPRILRKLIRCRCTLADRAD